MGHFIDVSDITPARWAALYRRLEDLLSHPGDYAQALAGHVLAALFYEPSTRTNFSFQAAMMRLGGQVFVMNSPGLSSVSKGETLPDTVVMCSGYADALVLRHPSEGAAKAASLYARCPIINAGDGGHQHPTQTLTDLTAITRHLGRTQGLTVGFCGDLRHGRTVHSLVEALMQFPDNQYFLISPLELTLPSYLLKRLREAGAKVYTVTGLEAAIPQLDVLYMTRIQKERFLDPLEYERHKGVYILTPATLRRAKRDMIVMHPLPRVDEIAPAVDEDPRAVYFEQARLGMFIRMALLLDLTETPFLPVPRPDPRDFICENERCITRAEPSLPPLADGGVCGYCEM